MNDNNDSSENSDSIDLRDRMALLHRRQFALGRVALKYRTDWISHKLAENLYLSHCPSLPIARATDRDGQAWHLLGVAVQSLSGAPAPDEQISSLRTAEVPGCYERWAGRWIALNAQELHLDASGLLGCYYLDGEAPSSDAAPVWASSSASLLAEICGPCVGTEDPRRPRHEQGLDWVPPPSSRFSAVRSLLPSQILNLSSRSIRPRLLLPAHPHMGSFEETVAQLNESLVTVLGHLGSRYSRIWLALTSGLDSRVLLAGCRLANLAVRTYTQDHPRVSVGDRLFPTRLSRQVLATHRFVRKSPFSPVLAALYDDHCAAHAAGANREFFARRQWAFPEAGDLALYGGCFEIGRCYFWDRFPGTVDSPVPPPGSEIAAGFGESGDRVVRGLAAWCAWVENHPEPGFDWRDRFYHEQRLAGWLSADEQSRDLLPIEFINPINSSWAFSLLLSAPPLDRATGTLELGMIRAMAPELLSLAVNPPQDSFNPAVRLWWNSRRDRLYPLKWLAMKFSDRRM